MSSISKFLPSPVLRFGWELRHRLALFPESEVKRILVVQLAGLGNAILTTPLIKALGSLDPPTEIDVLIERRRGSSIAFDGWDLVRRVWDLEEMYPHQGKLFYHYVLDAHPNTYLPPCIRYKHRRRFPVRPRSDIEYHWLFEKHETEYLLDHARALGYNGQIPSLRRPKGAPLGNLVVVPNTVAIGIGYFKDTAIGGRDWKDRHWGNENYLKLAEKLRSYGFIPVLVGDSKDRSADGQELEKAGVQSVCGKLTLEQMVEFLATCSAFIGNDTGLMHVAAAVGIPTVGIFVATNSVKSYPLGSSCIALGGDRGPQRYLIRVEEVLSAFFMLINKCFD
jgi:hypothetical protein